MLDNQLSEEEEVRNGVIRKFTWRTMTEHLNHDEVLTNIEAKKDDYA